MLNCGALAIPEKQRSKQIKRSVCCTTQKRMPAVGATPILGPQKGASHASPFCSLFSTDCYWTPPSPTCKQPGKPRECTGQWPQQPLVAAGTVTLGAGEAASGPLWLPFMPPFLSLSVSLPMLLGIVELRCNDFTLVVDHLISGWPKSSFLVFPKDSMEKPEWTFWPSQQILIQCRLPVRHQVWG